MYPGIYQSVINIIFIYPGIYPNITNMLSIHPGYLPEYDQRNRLLGLPPGTPEYKRN